MVETDSLEVGLEHPQVMHIAGNRRLPQSALFAQMGEEARGTVQEWQDHTPDRSDETGKHQPKHLFDGHTCVRVDNASVALSPAPCTTLTHPLSNKRIDLRRQVLPRTYAMGGCEVVEMNQRLNMLFDSSRRSSSLVEPIDIAIDGRTKPQGANAVGRPR